MIADKDMAFDFGSCKDMCLHRMLAHCPKCRGEIYGPAVFAFSHGKVTCGACGHKADAEFRNADSVVASRSRPGPATPQATNDNPSDDA
jgi:hypothetical protein